MNNFFRRLPLYTKLMLIGLVPMAYIIYLSVQVYSFENEKVDLFKGFLQRIIQSSNINNLISELQNERKYSYEFAVKRDMYSKVVVQRVRTDTAIERLKSSTDLALSDFPSYTFLINLAGTRQNIDTASHPNPDAIMYYYSNTIYRLNTMNAMPGGSVSFLRPVYKDFVAQKLLSEMITFLGIMRANIYNALFRKTFMVETLLGTRGVYDIYNSYEAEFLLKSSPAAIQSYKNLLENSNYKLAKRYLDSTFKRMNFDSA